MKKIGITTIIGDNYGSVLQNYALQAALKEDGAIPHLISVRPRSYLLNFYRNYFKPEKDRTLKTKLHKLKSDIANRSKRKKVKDFYKKNVNIRGYNNLGSVPQGETDTGTFICGSDQIWNPAFQPNSLYYLSFVPDGKEKYSYAASIAVDTISEKAQEFFRNALTSFAFISVREETGRQLLQGVVDQEKLRVDCDPVLLLEKETWERFVSLRFKGRKFLFLYMLRPSLELLEFARKVAKKKKLELVFIGDYYFGNKDIKQITDAGVEDFLSAVYYADYVITNSFHCTVFSTIFEKPFLSQVITKTGSRVNDYLNKLGLGERILKDQRVDELPGDIDYTRARKIILDIRESSRTYLNAIINS